MLRTTRQHPEPLAQQGLERVPWPWGQTMSSTQARDVMEQVTAQIVRRIEEGAGDWRMPWDVKRGETTLFAPSNASTGRRYQGGNILALWCSADDQGWT